MLLSIQAIEDAAVLRSITDQVDQLKWRDGRATAGAVAKRVKRNEQAIMSDKSGIAIEAKLRDIIAGHPVMKAAARPHRISPLMISRTANGGHYGMHVDNALMGQGANQLRTDLSFTLFLTDPENYEGGELLVHHAGAEQRVKGQAGELVLYPSSSIHEVTTVTAGTRIACVGWVESLIADHAQRELLFDLENLRVTMRASQPAGSAELLTIDKSIANLLRMWAKT